MEEKRFYTHEEIIDEFIGKKGTTKRNKYEEDLGLFLVGEAIKQARQAKNLTQEELGKMVGVQKAQISRIENGNNLTFATVRKLFKAMGLTVSLEVESLGKVSLC